MIVLDHGGGLRLVRQTDHAALSGDVARSWRAPRAIPGGFWPLFLEAARHHDDGWTESESAPPLEDGRPLDFKAVPVAHHVDVWRRTMDLAAARHPYVEVVVANHGRWLYTRFPRGGGPGRDAAAEKRVAQTFLEETAERIGRGIAELRSRGGDARAAVEPAAIEAARRLLSFLDAISLALLGGLPFFPSTEPLPFGETEAALSISEGRIAAGPAGRAGARIHPWPFDGEEIPLASRSLDLPATRFGSPRECGAAMAAAPPTRIEILLERGRSAPPARGEGTAAGALSRSPRDPL